MIGFLHARQDIPLDRDVTGRALPWVLGVLSFLAVLVLAGALSLQVFLSRWQSGLEGSVSVQLMPVEDQPDAQRLADMLTLLRASPEVEKAEPLVGEDMQKLLAPWLGEGALPVDLPVPQLIEVRLKPEVKDLTALRAKVATIQATNFDEHAQSMADVRHLVWLMLTVSYAIVVLISLSAMLIVWMLVRTGLAVHRDTIELLHLVGATDAYVARQFHRHITRLSVEGMVSGTLLAFAVLAGIVYYSQRLDSGLPVNALPYREMGVLLALVPVLGVTIASLTARQVALRLLRRMT